ncbi:MAG: hypothetical protein QM704_10750 [Anaeromyxobacteraceae bacterium]
MWTLEPRAPTAHLLAVGAYLAAVAAFLLVQEIGIRLQREEHRAWWAGSGRDLLNVGGLLAIASALRALGLSWPAALLVGGTLTLAMFGASVFIGIQLEWAHRRAWSFFAGLLCAIPTLVWLDGVVAAFAAATARLFPGFGP